MSRHGKIFWTGFANNNSNSRPKECLAHPRHVPLGLILPGRALPLQVNQFIRAGFVLVKQSRRAQVLRVVLAEAAIKAAVLVDTTGQAVAVA